MGVAASVALQLPPECCGSCGSLGAAVCVAAHCNQPPPRYQSRGYGVLHQQRTRCSPHVAAAAALHAAVRVLQLTAANPIPSSNPAAVGVLLQPLSCCNSWAAADRSQAPPHYQCRSYGGVSGNSAAAHDQSWALAVSLFACTVRGLLVACTAQGVHAGALLCWCVPTPGAGCSLCLRRTVRGGRPPVLG